MTEEKKKDRSKLSEFLFPQEHLARYAEQKRKEKEGSSSPPPKKERSKLSDFLFPAPSGNLSHLQKYEAGLDTVQAWLPKEVIHQLREHCKLYGIEVDQFILEAVTKALEENS